MSDLTRFLSYTEQKPGTDCIFWSGGKDYKGYGIFWYKNKTCFAHRISLLLHNKVKELTSGLVVRHSCKSKDCVNPEHLKEGTKSENAQDKVRDGTSLAGERCHFSKLSWSDVSEIRNKSSDFIKRRLIAEEYDVSISCINSVINNKSWIV